MTVGPQASPFVCVRICVRAAHVCACTCAYAERDEKGQVIYPEGALNMKKYRGKWL